MEFRVVTWNVWFDDFKASARHAALIAETLQQKPHVICFQEVTAALHTEMLKNPTLTREYRPSEPSALPHTYDVSIWVHRSTTIDAVSTTSIPTHLGRRGLAVDITLENSASFRVQTVHLESMKPNSGLRAQQLAVLLPELKEKSPALVLGDFNFCSSWPDENDILEQDGRIVDVWPTLRGASPGYTEDSVINSMLLKSKRGKHKQVRFDRVLLVAPDKGQPESPQQCLLEPSNIKLLGTKPLKTSPDVFPSDHFGLVAAFKVSPPPLACGGSAIGDSAVDNKTGTSYFDGVDGLSLYHEVLSQEDEAETIAWVDAQLDKGRSGVLVGRTYTAPPLKWETRGQSREMLQYGVFTHANRVQAVPVEPELPAPLASIVDALVARKVFRPEQRPTSCTVNVYAAGQYLPPHVDSTAFDRPFVTVSLESDHFSVFGDNISGAQGQWVGGKQILLPRRSALRVQGEAAGPVIKHALCAHPARRISLTFRKLTEEAVLAFEQQAAESEMRARERQRVARLAKEEKRALKASAKRGGDTANS